MIKGLIFATITIIVSVCWVVYMYNNNVRVYHKIEK